MLSDQKKDGSYLEFQKEIQDLSIRLLAPYGKYFVQGASGFNQKERLNLYEEQLSNLCCEVNFRKEFVFVPSFLELWTFYEIWKKETPSELSSGLTETQEK